MRAIADNPFLLVVLLLVIVLIFGAKRLPDAARSVGRSMRIFKSEVKEMKADDDDHRPGSGSSTASLEGRVVEDRRDLRDGQSQRTDEPHRGA